MHFASLKGTKQILQETVSPPSLCIGEDLWSSMLQQKACISHMGVMTASILTDILFAGPTLGLPFDNLPALPFVNYQQVRRTLAMTISPFWLK